MTDLRESIAEINARGAARGRYFNWLFHKFQYIQTLELARNLERISLRRIFVPLRAASEDLDEDSMPPEKTPPGVPLWDLLIRKPMLALSGKPGSGKTTVVRAVVVELCGGFPSDLRNALAGSRGIAPIPLVLRDFAGKLETLNTLDDLLDAWWNMASEQAMAEDLPLDVPRLKYAFDPEKEAYPTLLLFDGLDEIDGPALRSRVMDMALEAFRRGFRVVVTGRPSGYQNLASGPAPYYLVPFAMDQIRQFIQGWYDLADDWRRMREAGVRNFLSALRDANRRYLLTLARRPVFLTLMALIYCNWNEMPEGRAELYRRIVDLCLIRQERRRLRTLSAKGFPIPHWPDSEKRLALGYLAWRSQIRRSGKKGDSKHGAGGFVWSRKEMAEALEEQIRSGSHGRFAAIRPEDTAALLEDFLRPAGILVEAARDRIQFAHPSFQEYLCADFLYRRARVKGFREVVTEKVFRKLNRPGWIECGLMLFSIHADETRNEGHFELLGWLDPSDAGQADLFTQAVAGRELPFTDEERRAWLPVSLACVLLHPERSFGRRLGALPQAVATCGISLLREMSGKKTPSAQWRVLTQALARETPAGIGNPENHPIAHSGRNRWLDMKTDEALASASADAGWNRVSAPAAEKKPASRGRREKGGS